MRQTQGKAKKRHPIRNTILVLLAILLYLIVTFFAVPAFWEIGARKDAGVSPKWETGADADGTERVLVIDDRNDALMYRIQLIESAKETIDIADFELRDDEAGRIIMEALISAANRGVKIRFLLGGYNTPFYLSRHADYHALLSEENITVKQFRNLSVVRVWRNHITLHEKFILIDDQMYMLGGRNNNSRFLGDFLPEKVSDDRDVIVYETAPETQNSMKSVRANFEALWDSEESKPKSANPNRKSTKEARTSMLEDYKDIGSVVPGALDETDWEAVTLPTDRITLYATKTECGVLNMAFWNTMTEKMAEGDEVVITTPYAVLDQRMRDDLTAVMESGTHLSVILNSAETGMNPWGDTEIHKRRTALPDLGVDLYIYFAERAMHTKSMLVDDDKVLVGTFNLDIHSAYLDWECMLEIEGEEVNKVIREYDEDKMAHSIHVAPDGTETDGALLETVPLSGKRTFVYGLLGLLEPLLRWVW